MIVNHARTLPGLPPRSGPRAPLVVPHAVSVQQLSFTSLPRVVIDLEKLRFINCGLGQYSLYLGRELLRISPGRFEPVLLRRPGTERLVTDCQVAALDAVRWRRESVQRFVRPIARAFRRRSTVHLWHVTNQMSRYLPMDPSVPVLLTVHDLNFLRDRPRRSSERRIAVKLADLRRRVARAVAVVTDSHFVADELSRHVDLGERPVHVVPLGVEPRAASEARRPSWLGTGPFLLAVGNCLPHKNFHSLLPVIERLPGQRLVIAGKSATPYGRFLAEEVARRGLQSRVVMPGEVSDEERDWLYRHGDGLLFPSLAEGFGLPALEAMAAGRPVFVSRLTSLPEVVGDHGYYLDLASPDADARVIREGVAHFSSDPQRAAAARDYALGFSWSQTAAQYADLYERYALRTTGPHSDRLSLDQASPVERRP